MLPGLQFSGRDRWVPISPSGSSGMTAEQQQFIPPPRARARAGHSPCTTIRPNIWPTRDLSWRHSTIRAFGHSDRSKSDRHPRRRTPSRRSNAQHFSFLDGVPVEQEPVICRTRRVSTARNFTRSSTTLSRGSSAPPSSSARVAGLVQPIYRTLSGDVFTSAPL